MLTTATSVLSLNQPRNNAWGVVGETLLADSVEGPLGQFFTIGVPSSKSGGTLLVVLLPCVVGQPNEVDLDFSLDMGIVWQIQA